MKTVNDMIGQPEYSATDFWTNPNNIHEFYIQNRIFNAEISVHEMTLFHFIRPSGAIALHLPYDGRLKATHAGNIAEKHIGKDIADMIFAKYAKPYGLDELIEAQISHTKGDK